ncbi:MAG: DNA-binding response regulator [Gemmatimonadota bacterium]|nr:MAG: DNA-binding response regulator [Gemmatimonadota bacterium]
MSDPIRVLIVDDEPLARERLRSLLEKEDGIELIGECVDGRSAIETIDAEKPDLVFLDVQMPEFDGFDVLEAVEPNCRPVVVFVTAFDEYAVRAFEVHALDYVLKPFDRERFGAALGRARAEIGRSATGGGDIDQRLEALLSELEDRRKRLERIVVKSGGRVFFLRTEDVDWIEAAGNYVELHVGAESHLLRETMNQLEKRLDPKLFLRIHRRIIVNVERIRQLEGVSHGEYVVVLKDGKRLGSSRGYRESVQRLLETGA